MPTNVRLANRFRRDLKDLARKIPLVTGTVSELHDTLETGIRLGDKIPNVGYDVYKVRLPNRSAAKGKRGGFRVVYYLQVAEQIYLLTIYSKSGQEDIAPEDIRRIIEDEGLA